MKEYTLDRMQNLILDANQRMKPIHHRWNVMLDLFANGTPRNQQLMNAFKLSEDKLLIDRTVNLILPNIVLMENTVAGQDPDWIANPNASGLHATATDKELESLLDRSQFAKAVVSFYWNIANGTVEAGYASKDSVRLGKGFIKNIWSSYVVEVDKDEDQVTAEQLEVIQAEEEAAQAEGRDMLSLRTLRNQVAETEEVYVDNKAVVSYVSPFNIRVPANARSVDETRWIAERIILDLDDAEDREEYQGYLRNNKLVLSTNPFDEDQGANSYQSGTYSYASEQYVEIWEFWDFATRKLYHIQLDANEILFETDFPWSHNLSPYAEFNNYKRDGNDFWGFGDIDNVAGIQLLVNEVMRARISDMTRSGNKYMVNSAFLTPQVREALESTKSDVVVPINAGRNAQMPDVIQPVPRLGAQPEVWNAKTELGQDLNTVMGITDFQAGSLGPSRVSGTAAAAVDGSSAIRSQAKVQSIERAISKAGAVILKLAQEFLDDDTVIRIGGANATKLLDVSPGDIEGDFDVTVVTDSTSAMNPATRSKRAVDLINLVPIIQTAMQDPSLMPLLRQAVTMMGFNPNAILPPVPAPAPQALAPGMPGSGLGAEQAPTGPDTLGLDPRALQGLLGALPQAAGETGNPLTPLEELGGPPVPSMTEGDIAL